MASARPYSGMGSDDLKKRVEEAEQRLIHELRLIDEELGFRDAVPAAQLKHRVSRILKSLSPADIQRK